MSDQSKQVSEFPQFRVYVKGSPVEFTSAFPDLASAFKVLDANQRSDFARDLVAAAKARRLSDLQIAWLHKLATDAVTPRATTTAAVQGLDLLPILTMLERAAEAQKRRPRITLQTIGGQPVVLTLAGAQSSQPGTVTVTNGVYPGKLFARILRDGTAVRGRDLTMEVEQLLRTLAANPARVANQHGCATGKCCFCNLPLSTAESRSVGYGPICADKFGLPWGSTEVADAADAAAKDPFKGLQLGEDDTLHAAVQQRRSGL